MPSFHPADPVSWATRGLAAIHVGQRSHPQDRDILLSLKTRRLRQICSNGARVEWGDEALFDLIADAGDLRIECCPRLGWNGKLPTGFYATVAALACAWRGDIAFHCSAVAWRGRAVLIGGPAGAGKSTSLVAMLAAGAQLIGDDLSVIVAPTPDAASRYRVWKGRPYVRLHPANLEWIDLNEPPRSAGDNSGKWLARPANPLPEDSAPLAGIVLLGSQDGGRVDPLEAATRLPGLLFRPLMQGAMPSARSVAKSMVRMAGALPVAAVASPSDFSAGSLLSHGRALLDLADSWIDCHPVAPPQQEFRIHGG